MDYVGLKINLRFLVSFRGLISLSCVNIVVFNGTPYLKNCRQ